ncbi:FBD-associated F-box protein At5g18780-like [Trifolium pratense]|uniref:FBD-associated F-box protein At5g18780-like n=1 Tax=Trifolium pratense TaxID=57577 RepID=UPI001E6903AB|nr:FBD-associated F-box protein At5g18780-like [Trifolium pratense]XP_045792021.1 FBD-associated F-box protein At5g18780-like [Trifolium pratense]
MEQAEDKLSILPKFILHNILSRLPEEDAYRTSVLSKAWLETWYTFPILCFYNIELITESKSKDLIEYVKSRLLRFWEQRLAIKEFNFSIIDILGCMSNDFDLCLKLVSESGVEVLDVCFPKYSSMISQDEKGRRGECYYVLPKGVIEIKSLTKLVLEGGIRVDEALRNHSIKFFSLRELHLLEVVLKDGQAIECLISCCPLIEVITLMLLSGSMKSLSMRGLKKLKTVYVDGIKEVYIDEANSSLKSLYYCHDYMSIPIFKIEFIQCCKFLKELLLSLYDTTIITEKWFLEILPKFPFLETLEIWNCILSETINISSVQLKYLRVSDCSNLKVANIDAPNLLTCNFKGFNGSKPIISFLNNISTQLQLCLSISIYDFDIFYVRELLQNIKPQNVFISLFLSISCSEGAPRPVFLDIPSPPPSIKHLDLDIEIHSEINETLYSDIADFLLLCFVPEYISWNNLETKQFVERNERIGNVMFRENIAMNVKFWKEVKSLKVLSSKSRVRTESHIDFHLGERRLVATTCLVGIKERM